MQAMILAAGLGTRLLPHTGIRPKPLFPLLNSPLLLLTIERLKNHGYDHIIVNCHHLRSQIVDTLSTVGGVTLIEEEVILGTGGGLRGALQFMRDEPLLITNGDIYHTVDLSAFYHQHMERKSLITMGMHDYPRFNRVQMDGERVVAFGGEPSGTCLAFTGIQVINPQVLENIEEGRFSCIIDHYRNLLRRDTVIYGLRVDGCHWTDMGTVEDYLALHEGLLYGNIPCWPEMGEVGKPHCISAGAQFDGEVEIGDWACVGDARVRTDIRVERSVIWDGVVISGSDAISDSVVSEDREK